MTSNILRAHAHRPFPLPSGPWVMFQSWRKLLFAHWPIAHGELRALVPEQLELEEFDGSAWVGLTPFYLRGLRPRFLPPVPGLSSFPEMNLRTYVRVGDKAGIFFFSLDAANTLAVIGARIGYALPYRRASMRIRETAGWFHYRSRRADGKADFVGRYRPVGDVFEPARGTLEYFLTERYALYTVLPTGTVLRGDIHHPPWRIRPAEVEITTNSVAHAARITLPDRAPLAHFAERQDTLVWPPKRA